ncbi:polynucleotide kinase [Achromobacter phage Motura]|uniref:Polynucleotide kinase n=1 Tax=Achromobacter phage Motura TaxID=2591403 RepID=A0A514CSS1_9CAUD|nr:polynucleotide kinase [Achromobacter phage Motura]QDH83522.1 polynucleotide kinase [Achromobacter phage Motura]
MHSITILIGINGCGKTAWRNRLIEEERGHLTFSIENCVRGFYYSHRGRIVDMEIMDAFAKEHPKFPEFMWRKFEAALDKFQSVIIDGDFITPEQRAPFIDKARARNIPVYAVVFNTPFDIAYERNRRQRKPYRVTKRELEYQVRRLDISTLKAEVDDVHYVDNIQVKGFA